MNKQQLQGFFIQPYERDAWLHTLRAVLPRTDVFKTPQPLSASEARVESIAQLGSVRLHDDRRLGILEIGVQGNLDVARNRVGLRNVVTQFIDQAEYHGMLATFRGDDSPAYRFTFAARESQLDETGTLIKRETAPRRYTYLLGPTESCRTPAERFERLAHTGDRAELKDVTDAFSVEKLNNDFFADYCKVFQRVRKDIAERHPRWPKEIVEQQTQTLLNRLLFLCFVQRKGWLNRQRDYLVRNFRENFAQAPNSISYLDKFLRPVFEKLSTEGTVADIAEHDLPFLNGGLFSDEYGAEQLDETLRRHKQLKVNNATFQHVFDDLLEIYNFTIREDSPTDQEVAIDPEMLGKIFESLVLQIEKSDGGTESLRHDTGSHYTPRPIVHYLCTEGLRGWLEQFPPDPARAATWPQRLETLLAIDANDGIDEQERAILDECLTPEEAKALLDRLDTLRACDPAVGSGAFPVGLLHELVNLMRLCETRSRGKDPVERDSNWLYDTKSGIIRRVLYGVDIQERAVEICKLRLWLSLMVDFDIGVDVDNCSRSAFRAALKNITPLPNLDYKIRRADSLIDRVCGHPVILPRSLQDASVFNDALNKLSSAKLAFYSAHTARDRRKHHFDILAATADLALNVFKQSKLDLKGSLIPLADDIQRLREIEQAATDMLAVQSQIKAARKLPAAAQDDELQRISAHFDDPAKPTFVWQLDFAEVFHRKDAAGFDFMVGNPPYVRIQALRQSSQDVVEQLKERYASARKGNYDLYVPFVERGLNLLQTHGQLAYILPHKFFNTHYGEPLRSIIAGNRQLRHVVHFGDYQIFPGATNYVCLLFLAKAGIDVCRWVRVRDFARWLGTQREVEETIHAKHFTSHEWNFAGKAADQLLQKLRQSGPRLLDLPADMSRGSSTGDDDVFVLNANERLVEEDILRIPVYATDFDRYAFAPNKKWRVIFPYQFQDGQFDLIDEADLEARFPKAFRYLVSKKAQLKRRKQARVWYGFSAPRNLELHEHPHFLIPLLAQRSSFAMLPKEYHAKLCPMASGGFTVSLSPKAKLRPEYVLALLNSPLMFWMLLRTSNLFHGGWITCTKQYFGELPIRPINFADASERTEHDAVAGLVEQALAARRADPTANVSALEQDIDARVYRLYGLTKDEIKIVEESAQGPHALPATPLIAQIPKLPTKARRPLDAPQKYIVQFILSTLALNKQPVDARKIADAFSLISSRRLCADLAKTEFGDLGVTWMQRFNETTKPDQFRSVLCDLYDRDIIGLADVNDKPTVSLKTTTPVPRNEWVELDVLLLSRLQAIVPENTQYEERVMLPLTTSQILKVA